MVRLFATLFLLFLSVGIVVAQDVKITEAQARAELRKRGLDEDEVRQKLEARGFDIDNLDASQLPELEKALEEVVQEIEAEKGASSSGSGTVAPAPTASPPPPTNELKQVLDGDIRDANKEELENIQQSVEDGKPLDQAIAEELIDRQQEQLPPSGIYGQQLFRDKRISVFSQSEDIRPSDSYIMGPGDQVNISIWGLSQENATYEVNKSGYIKPTEMPRINLSGITFAKARKLIESRFAQYYRFRPEEFEVTISYARTITVNIYGAAHNPGGYTLPATNTAFNALVAAGGPSDIGSVRNIRLIRSRNNDVETIDVYEFMNDPSVQERFYLQDNDIIHVGIAKRTMSIKGAVRRPSRYELLPNENLKQLIEYAGGLKDNAFRTNLRVTRYENDAQRIIDIPWAELTAKNQDFELMPGDIVVVNSISTPYKNFVEITGSVELGDKYELIDGMRITDLVQKGVLKEDARTDVAYLLRTNPDGRISYERIDLSLLLSDPTSTNNLLLRPKDRILILSQATFVNKATISVAGAVRSPNSYEYDANEAMRISDAITLAGGLRPEATAFAYITRVDLNNPKKKEFIRFDIREAVTDVNSSSNQILQPGDQIKVFSTETYTDEFEIGVAGAVRAPGKYRWEQSLKLKDVLTLAGGLKLEAASSRIDIARLVIQDNEPTKTIVATVEVDKDLILVGGDTDMELQPFDQIYVRTVPEFEMQRNVQLNGEVKYPGTYPLIDNNEKISSIIARAGGLTSEAFLEGATLYRGEGDIGYVIMDMEEALQNQSSRYNFILKQGDVIDVPKRKDLVSINIANTKAADLYPDKLVGGGKLNVAYHNGKKANYYVKKYAAGLGEKGRGRLITVEHPNGEIERTKNFLFLNVYPKVRKGSVVSIGEKKEKPKKEKTGGGDEDKEGIDWGKTIADTLAQTTAVLSLILLIQQINR
ncbi:MAG: SLBB domain-containing protein [Bacteroidota bacterium]